MLGLNNQNSNYIAALKTRYLCVTTEGTVVFSKEADALLLADHFNKSGNLPEAINVITFGISVFPDSAELYAYKATLLIEQGQDDEVILTYIDKALDLAPNDKNILLLKAEVLCNGEHFEDAEAILDFIADFSERHELEKVHLLKAFINDHQEDFEGMFNELKEVLHINPKNVEALTQMWLATAYSEKYEECIAIHEEVLEHDPYCSQAWHNLGYAHYSMKNYNEAIFSYEYATLTNSQNELSFLDWGISCLEAERFDEALTVYQEIEKEFGADAEIFTKMGLCHQKMNNFVAASQNYAKALRNDENNHDAHYRMGECLMIQNDYQSAIIAFRKAIEIKGQFEEYHLALARAYEETGNIDKAREAYDDLITVAPECPEHWLYQVDFFCKIKNFKEALETLEMAEMNISRSAYTLYHRAVCFFRMGNRDEAMQWLQEALLENYAMHGRIFQALPHLERDHDVINLIRTFR
jgi:tetratricopeptide (TPR) repeat protein